ncbi:MAG: AmmeMemoRadiSam system protein B [Spirochaeta sp.]|nr:AmmeMemoRadiSam system protein B [Spirochaeta sp.]
MALRKRGLPPGWYPLTELKTRERIEEYLKNLAKPDHNAMAGIVPHAGWEFSGRVALAVLQNIYLESGTVVVIGGHLPAEAGVLAASEEEYETPLGNIDADMELLKALKELIPVHTDRYPDNTVEVQLPFIKYLFPRAKALALRAAPAAEAIRLGEILAELSLRLKRNIAVIGSTDLTHYGSNYGFAPQGRKAVRWVREVNDKRIIESLLALNHTEAINRALAEKSACSVGGAVAAAAFAGKR